MEHPFSIGARLKSFRYAGRGIRLTVATQHNAWIHAAASGLVIAAGLVVGLSRLEWIAIVIACSAVWTAEALNTALEFLADAVTVEAHPLVGNAKDVAAGAVLITALAAVATGILVFVPHFRGLHS